MGIRLQQPSTADGAKTASCVLIVEDDPGGRRALRMLLEFSGFECLAAADGDEALRMMEERPPDIVLTDMMMPGIDGIELTRRVKGSPWLADVPVLLLTADTSHAVAEAAREAGCDGLVAKPIRLDDLLARMQGHRVA